MATFSDLHRVLEDTLRVDMKQRWTPQEVKFVNTNNEFYGKFTGKLYSSYIKVDEARIISAYVDHLFLGDGTDLAKYRDFINDLYDITDKLSNDIVDLSDAQNYISSQVEILLEFKDYIQEQLNKEITNRESQDNKLSADLVLSVDALIGRDNQILSDLNEFKKYYKDSLVDLSVDLKKYVDDTKHFDIDEIEIISEEYALKDYTANKIDDSIPHCYVTTNKRKIGYVTNVELNADKTRIYSFILHILPDAYIDYPSLGKENFTYEFKNEQGYREFYTGVDNFKLIWDPSSTKIRISLQAAASEYFDVMFGDQVVARLDYFKINDEKTGLDYGRITFNEVLGDRIKNVSFIFDEANKDYINYEKDISIRYDGSEGIKVTFDVSKGIWYHQLADKDGTEFGRIISGDVEYDINTGDINLLKVLYGRKYQLDNTNDFKALIDGKRNQYVTYKNNKVYIETIEKYIQFQLSSYNISTGKVIERNPGVIQLSTYNSKDPIDEVKAFCVQINDVDYPEWNGTYTLTPVDDPEKWESGGKSETEFEGYNETKTVRLNYNKKYSKSLIKIIRKGETKEIGCFFVDIQNSQIFLDNSSVQNESSNILSSGVVVFDTLDGSALTIKETHFDINDKKKDHDPSIVEVSELDDSSYIAIRIPTKTNSRARTFDLIIEPRDFIDGQFKEVKIVTSEEDKDYKFYYNGRDVTNSFYINKWRNVFRFIELDDAADNIKEFQIVDMNNTEILDRECVSFMGELYNKNPEDHHLSCYLTQGDIHAGDTLVKRGFMYIAADKTGILYDGNDISVQFGKDDHIMFKTSVQLKNAAISDFVVTRNAQVEVESLCTLIFDNFVKLSGDNFISGDNTISSLHVMIENVDDANIDNLSVANEIIEKSFIKDSTIESLSATDISVSGDRLHITDAGKTFRDICCDLQNQITSNDYDISSISMDLYVNEDQFHNKGLSGKVEFLLRQGRDSMEYKGDLSVLEPGHDDELTCFFAQGHDGTKADVLLKKGYVYRSLEKTPELTTDTSSIRFGKNDYIIFNSDVKIKNIETSSFNVIRDAQDEVEKLKSEAVLLSGNNSISGYNEFTEDVSINRMSVDNAVIENSSTRNALISSYIAISGNVSELVAGNEKIEFGSLEFTDTGKTAKDICVDIQNQIISNDYDISSISAALFITPDRFGNKGLSGKVDFLLSNETYALTYAGELIGIDYTKHEGQLKCFIAQGDDTKYGRFIRKGTLYRISCDTPRLSDCAGQTDSLRFNDYIFTKNECILSNITFQNLAIIRDSQKESEALQKWVNDNFLHLSGGDYVQNTEYFNSISATSVSVVNETAAILDVTNKMSVENADIVKLSVSEEIADSIKVNDISADDIYVDISSVNFTDILSTGSDIRNQMIKNSSDIVDIYRKIEGVIDYKDVLTLSASLSYKGIDGFTKLFLNNGFNDDDYLSANWTYLIRTNPVEQYELSVDGIKVGDKDYLTISVDCQVKNLSKEKVFITDTFDGNTVHIALLSAVSSLISTDLSVERERITNLSTWTNDNFFHLTGDNQISGIQTVKGSVIADNLSSTSLESDNTVITHLSASDICVINTINTNDANVNGYLKSNNTVVENLSVGLGNVKFTDVLSSGTDICVHIQNQVTNNTDSISTLSGDYHKFVDNTFQEPTNSHISSYNLIITDESHSIEPDVHDRYYLTFKDGTLVLIKK